MSTKTKSGLLPVVVVGALVLGATQTDIGQQILEDIGIGGDPSPGGSLVPPSHRDRVKNCTPEQMVKNRKCDDLPLVIIDAELMPHIARNVNLAWGLGHLPLLHSEKNPSQQSKNRNAACGKFAPTVQSSNPKKVGSCDEYPFASSKEGGAGARTEEVPREEQGIQAGKISATTARLKDGDEFLVVIINPNKIAPLPYKG